MPGLIQGLEIARRALVAHQSALNVTSNNIANVNTKGYSRQRALLVASPDEKTADGFVGTGVTMEGVERMRDGFVDAQVRQEMGVAGEWSARSDALSQLESVVNEPSDQGLAAMLDGFWNACQDLSNQPEDTASRAAVVAAAQNFTDSLHDMVTRLGQISESARAGVQSDATQVNDLLREVGSLNVQIAGAEAGGQAIPGLLDRRDLVLDQLADLAGATASTRSDGSAYVRIAGRTAVNGGLVEQLGVRSDVSGGSGALRVVFGSDSAPISSPSGKIGGLLEVSGQEVPEFLGQLDVLASGLADSVNRLHRAGPSHLNFFTGTSAESIAVTPGIVADATLVNAGKLGDPGDNDIALAIGALRNARVMNRGTASISDFYRLQINGLGTKAQQANQMNENQSAAVQSLEAQRQSVMGVNLDEELTGMIATQKAYQAAARIFSVVSTMLDDLLKV